MIIDKRFEQLKMDFHLWSQAAVGQLIEQEFGIKLQARSVGKYLTCWSFAPQNPSSARMSKAPQRRDRWLSIVSRSRVIPQTYGIVIAIAIAHRGRINTFFVTDDRKQNVCRVTIQR